MTLLHRAHDRKATFAITYDQRVKGICIEVASNFGISSASIIVPFDELEALYFIVKSKQEEQEGRDDERN